MKVAVIGAGLSGLYCAYELERFGIVPDIYEVNSYIGDPYSHTTAILNITHRPIKDFIVFLKQRLDIDVIPHNILNRLSHNSPNLNTTLTGNFGYFFKYSKDVDSLKHQIYSKLKKSKVYFNVVGDYQELSKKYDYVVIANGTVNFAKELGCWQKWLKTYVRGATVHGDFDPTELIMWINKDYTKNGYAYLTPFDSHKASLVLITTDVNENEIDSYWQEFLFTENIKYEIIEEFKLEHKSGLVYPHRLNNMFFIGNAGGGVEPFLGFGHLNSATMALASAKAIAFGYDYEKQISDIMNVNYNMKQFRKVFNNLTNPLYDYVVASIRLPGLKHLLYYTNFNVGKVGGFVLKYILKDKYRM